MVTIADIAKKAGVAKSTVSNVLSNKKFVSQELSDKILKICKEMDFQPNFYASTLLSGKTNIIALFLEQNDAKTYQSFYNELIKSCIINASCNNYNVLIYYGMANDKIISALQQGRAPVDGAIILSPCLNDERINQIHESRIPCVVIGRLSCALEDVGEIDVDNYKLCYDISMRMLTSRYKTIGLINSKKDLTISLDRVNGFSDAAAALGLKSVFKVLYSDNSTEYEGYVLAKQMIKNCCPDVIVAANEFVAVGVYRALNEAGKKIGEDVSVFALGCEGLIPDEMTPALSYAHQDYYEIGRAAVEMLLSELETGKRGGAQKCPCSIHFNESCPIESQ